MTAAAVQNWLEKLGYAAEPDVLHLRGEAIPETHPYALEIKTLLKPDGAVRAQAVFDVEGVPTVVFVAEDGAPLSNAEQDPSAHLEPEPRDDRHRTQGERSDRASRTEAQESGRAPPP